MRLIVELHLRESVQRVAEQEALRHERLANRLGDGFGVVRADGFCRAANLCQHARGNHDVRNQQRRQRDGNGIQPDSRDFGEQPKRKGFQHLDDEHAHHPECQQVARAHAPVDVEALLGVVPPARVEQFFHQPAGDIFQRAAEDEGEQECRFDLRCPQGQKVRHQHSARAVNRAQRAEQKAAVDEAPELHELTGDLHAPAEEGAGEEEENIHFNFYPQGGDSPFDMGS